MRNKEIACGYCIGRNPHILTQSPFHIIAQYFWVGTDILHSILAVKTSLASYHRGYRHWRSDLISPYPFPYLVDIPCDFMAQDGGRMDAPCLFPTEDTHIGSTYRVGSHLDENFINSNLGRSPYPRLPVGQLVRVEHGSLEGLVGVVKKYKNEYRLVISVTLLMRSVSVEIDQSWLTPIGNEKRFVPQLVL